LAWYINFIGRSTQLKKERKIRKTKENKKKKRKEKRVVK